MLTETDWKDQARAIKAASPELSCPEIAEKLGRSSSAVWKALHPERTRELNRRQNEKRHTVKLAWQREKDRSPEGRGVCPGCGGPLGYGGARDKRCSPDGRQNCAECLHASRVARARQIERWWRDGLPVKEIAARLGWSKGALCKESNWMRRNGFDMPYRYQAWAVKAGVPASSTKDPL